MKIQGNKHGNYIGTLDDESVLMHFILWMMPLEGVGCPGREQVVLRYHCVVGAKGR